MNRGIFLSPALALVAAPTMANAQTPKSVAVTVPPVPAAISLVDEGRDGMVYRESSSNLRLYIYERDPAGQSLCIGACAGAWPAVRAPANARPVGDWTLVMRPDGMLQWALKGHPVYTRTGDQPAHAGGTAISDWRRLIFAP